jgi:predicted metal-dependent phosphoesterase TrpH
MKKVLLHNRFRDLDKAPGLLLHGSVTKKRIKVCLHNHTRCSKYGLSWIDDFRRALDEKSVSKFAITDHNTTAGAKAIRDKLGEDRIIIGEEIDSSAGEIIGLFLTKAVERDLPLRETCRRIKDQGGIVYIPHPGINSGVPLPDLEQIADDIDIVEAHNGWTHFAVAGGKRRQRYREMIEAWCIRHGLPMVSATDSHYPKNLGRSYTVMKDFSNAEELKASVKEDTLGLVRERNMFGMQAFPAFFKGVLHL